MITLSRILIVILLAVNPAFCHEKEIRPPVYAENIVFDDYEKLGLILAGKHSLFSHNMKKTSEREFTSLTAARIIQLSREMFTPDGSQKPCSKVHFVKVVAGPDTLILSGDVISEIRESFNSLNPNLEKVYVLYH